jgi:hypothetical protein
MRDTEPHGLSVVFWVYLLGIYPTRGIGLGTMGFDLACNLRCLSSLCDRHRRHLKPKIPGWRPKYQLSSVQMPVSQ